MSAVFHSVALFQFRPDAEQETISAFESALRTFAEGCSGLLRFSLGHDLRLRPGTDDLAVYVAFESRAALETYLHAPDTRRSSASTPRPSSAANTTPNSKTTPPRRQQ